MRHLALGLREPALDGGVVVGAAQDALGRPVLNIETFVPRVKDDRPACALYKRKEDFETSGTS